MATSHFSLISHPATNVDQGWVDHKPSVTSVSTGSFLAQATLTTSTLKPQRAFQPAIIVSSPVVKENISGGRTAQTSYSKRYCWPLCGYVWAGAWRSGGAGIEGKCRKIVLILSDSSTIVKQNTKKINKISFFNSLIYVASFAKLRFSCLVQCYVLLFSINNISLTFYQLSK